jgi:voltage-gated potassium channel
MPGPIVSHQVQRFRTNPVSVRNAMAIILTATILTVFVSGFLVWLVDRENFPNMGIALWWAIQTVTTVGYGDVTPTTSLGRLIASFVLIESIAFLSIVTAVITSTFVEQARRERQKTTGEPSNRDLSEMITELTAKVDHLEQVIQGLRDDPGSRSGRDR